MAVRVVKKPKNHKSTGKISNSQKPDLDNSLLFIDQEKPPIRAKIINLQKSDATEMKKSFQNIKTEDYGRYG